MPDYGCRQCARSFQELKLWDKLKFCGDHWVCTDCDADIMYSPAIVHKKAIALAKMIGKDLFVPQEQN